MNITRRTFLVSSASVCAFPVASFAETQTKKFKYIPSKLGIDYRALAPSPLAEMLSQGEVEWMENAPSKYGNKAGRLWKLSISKKVSTGAISKSVIEKLRAYTPNMLTKFAVGLNPQDKKYSYLWSIGNLFVAERFAGKAWYFCKYRNHILQLKYTSCTNSMHHIDTPNIADNWKASAPTSAEAFATAKQDKLDSISKIDNPQLQKLAKAELQELNALEKQKALEQLWVQNARVEFKNDMNALKSLEQKFGALENFDQFANFLISGELSNNELEAFYETLNMQLGEDEWEELMSEFQFDGFPLSREAYTIFEEKFGIPTSTNLQERKNTNNEVAKDIYLNSLPALASISDVPQVAELGKMIAELENLQGSEAQNQMLAISSYLVWPDGESWELDIILIALKEKDAENTLNGNPTKHFETFTRTVRDFSPDVSNRIDIFVASYKSESADNEPVISSYQKWLIEGAIPEGSKLEANNHGTFTATTPEGDTVQITKEGNHLSRSYALNGSEFALQTPLIHSDFTKAQSEYEMVNQTLSPKLQKTENALSFLENRAFADVPLADMQEGLRKTLGYSKYEALGIQNITDKNELMSLLKNNVTEFKQELADANRAYEKAIQTAVAENRRHNAESDEKIKTTLKALRNSGLEFLDIDFLITNIKAGFITPDIWVPFDRQNLDLASGNFWETLSDTNNPTKHIEYIYRIANKVLTGNPDGTVDGKLIGFSLDQAILNPDVAQKTDADVKHLLKRSGAWSETIGVDRVKVEERLEEPTWFMEW